MVVCINHDNPGSLNGISAARGNKGITEQGRKGVGSEQTFARLNDLFNW